MIPSIIIQFLTSIIALSFAYIISVSISGYAQAYIANWAGDSTPDEAGCLSGDPYFYIDWLGFFCTIFLGFGWGKIIPFRPMNVHGPHRMWRVFAVYITQPLTSILISFLALLLNLILTGPQSLCIALQYALGESLRHTLPIHAIAQQTPGLPTWMIVVSFLLVTIVSVNMFLALWSFLHNIWYHILFIGAEQRRAYMQYADLILLSGPLIVFMFLGPIIRVIFLEIAAGLACIFGRLLGVV